MKIIDLLKQKSRCFSFEFFPPKNEDSFVDLYKTIGRLKELNPCYVSVTYGAGGGTRRKTIDLVSKIEHEIGIESMAHITCVGSTKEEIDSILAEFKDKGIENVLALRGDPPQGEEIFIPRKGGFRYANELVEFIKEKYDFCIGVAGYPEGHIECPTLEEDLENLKRKVDAGGDFIVTQLFFDNRFYFDFVERARKIGITVPIIPGIMPILNLGQVKRFTEMCGSSIPDKLLQKLESVKKDNAAVEAFGIDHALKQCQGLLDSGASGIHFYTLNRSKATQQILENLREN
ncbi:MAG: methylenetetrahydrofolate reductase [NAD(P)H] [Thermodesulfobacteriota bacterium]